MCKRGYQARGCVVVPLPAQLIGNTMCLWLPSILVNKKSQALLSLAFWLTTHRLTSYRWQSLPHPRSCLYCNADDDDLHYRLHIIDFDARRSAKEAFKDFCLRLAQLAARPWQPGSTRRYGRRLLTGQGSTRVATVMSVCLVGRVPAADHCDVAWPGFA